MLTGLEILLNRMKTNPEEFLKDNSVPYEGEAFGGKWADLLTYAWRVATEEERKALDDARREFYRDDFNERVMKRLAGEEVKQDTSPPYIVKQPQQPHWTDPRMAMQGQIQPLQQNGMITTTIGSSGGFGQAQIKAEGMRISSGGTESSFWGGIAKTLGGR